MRIKGLTDQMQRNQQNDMQNAKLELAVGMEYSRQLNQLINYIYGSKTVQRVQLQKATEIMKKLQSGLLRLQGEQNKIKRNLNNNVCCQTIMVWHEKLLKETATEITEFMEEGGIGDS
jgi:hypothetical protein